MNGQQPQHQDPAGVYTIPPSPAAVVIAKKFRTKMCQNFVNTGTCPYLLRCVFAHGKDSLRTCAMNLRDNVTSEEAIKAFQRHEIESRQRAGLPALPENMRLPIPMRATPSSSGVVQPVASATILQPASQYPSHLQTGGGLNICAMQMSGAMEPKVQQYSVVRLDLPMQPMLNPDPQFVQPHLFPLHQPVPFPFPAPVGPSSQLRPPPVSNPGQQPIPSSGRVTHVPPIVTVPPAPSAGSGATAASATKSLSNSSANGMKPSVARSGAQAGAPSTPLGQNPPFPVQKSPTGSSGSSPKHGAAGLADSNLNGEEEQSTEVPLPTSPLLHLDIEPLEMPEFLGYPTTPQNLAVRQQLHHRAASFDCSGSLTHHLSQMAPLPVSEASAEIPGAGNSETGSESGMGGGPASSRSSTTSSKYRHSPYSWTLVEQHGRNAS
jgi:hypothetical protein